MFILCRLTDWLQIIAYTTNKNEENVMTYFSKTVLFSVLLSTSFAQGMESFRSQSTGMLMEDDLDLMLQPLELGHTSGYRLYTNLSNLGSGSEQALGNSTDNSLVLGIGGDIPWIDGLKGSFFVEQKNSTVSGPLSIDYDQNGVADVFGNGVLEGAYSRYFDTDNDGLYNSREVRSWMLKDSEEREASSVVLNTSYQLGVTLLGLGLKIYGDEFVSLQHQEALFENYSLTDGFRFSEGESSSSGLGNDLDGFEFLLGAEREMYDGELSALLHIGSNSESENSITSDTEEARTWNPWQNHAISVESYSNEIDLLDFGLSMRYRRNMDDAIQRRNVSFWDAQLFLGMSSGDESVIESLGESSFEYEEEMDSFSSLERVDRLSGDRTGNHLAFSIRSVRQLDDRSRFAIGLSYSHSFEKSDLAGAYSISEYDSSSIFATESSDAWQYWSEGTVRQSYSEIRELTETMFSIPVGLEYLFSKNKKWRMRLGAIYSEYEREWNSKQAIRESNPYVREEYDSFGNYSVTMSENSYPSHSESRIERESSTVFSYGLSYEPSQSIQVDFISFFGDEDNEVWDTSFFRNLRLSVIMKF